jgi:hypothetical protein
MTAVVPPLKYERAPDGAPDRFRLTADTTFYWRDVPERFWRRAAVPVHVAAGCLMRSVTSDNKLELMLMIYEGYHASVSVAPDSPRSTPGAFPHDWIYEHSARIAALWGCRVRDVLALADWWFLALLTFTGFRFRRTYFTIVRLLGYQFNRIFGANK